MLTPPPLLPNWDIFEFQTFFIKAKLQNIAKIIEIGTFLKNRDPPLCFQNSQIEIGTFLFFFTPLLGHCPKFSRFSILMAPLSIFFTNCPIIYHNSRHPVLSRSCLLELDWLSVEHMGVDKLLVLG